MPIDSDRLKTLLSEAVPDAIAFRRDLHRHPEIGYEEFRTAERIRSVLRAEGIAFAEGLAGGTGTVAHLPGADEGDAVALRADIDALPIDEESTHEWRSTVAGRMHACGHDGHATTLLTAARVLARVARDAELPRPVTFLFQPAEEGGAGGKRMCEDGCLDGRVLGPRVRRIYGLHGWPGLPLGSVGVRAGPFFACSDRFEIEVEGEGAHAAWPHAARDPVLAASAIVVALQSIVARNVDPLDAAVVSATTIHAGSATNVIPRTARIGGTARALSAHVRETLERRILEVAESVAAAHGCSARARYHHGYPVTANDASETDRVRRIATDALGASRVHVIERPVMGGEDFSYYAERVPASFFLLGLLPSGQPAMPSLHHPRFDFNDDAIPIGAEVFCRLALEPAAR